MYPDINARVVRRNLLVLVLCISGTTATAWAQTAAQPAAVAAVYRIGYEVRMAQPATHLFEVQVEVETPAAEPAVEFQLPRWSPGRYAVFDFAKNVQEVTALRACEAAAADCSPTAVRPERVDTQTWRVPLAGARRVRLSYQVYADDLSGTFSQLDERHANFNGGALFMYVVGHKADPVTLSIVAPAGWRVVNGRTVRADQRAWTFANYDILIDTPTEIGPDWTEDTFQLDGRTYHVVLHALGGDGGRRKALVRDLASIVRAETALWGPPDFSDYTFLIHTGLPARGDGMEHLTSTQIITRPALTTPGAYEDVLDTAAHEFFHVWNVKRLRPVELGPWDFTRPLTTRTLWVAEGLTNYYGHLMQRRAGLWPDERLWRELAAEISAVENAPGSRTMSAEEASLVAPFLDLACSVQQTNLTQTSVSYYDKGEVVGLVLDLTIRAHTDGRASLDDVMRRMYEEFYLASPAASYYLRGRGYTSADFQRVAAAVAGTDLSEFFAHYVRGTQPLPYDDALAPLGLRLVKTPTRSDPTHSDYRIEALPDAPAQAQQLRRAWLRGGQE